MKETVRRTKFIPRVGNWESQAKRQSVALYGDYAASAGPRRSTAKAGRPPLSRGNAGELLEGGRLPSSPERLAETTVDGRLTTHETPGITNSPTSAYACSAGVDAGHELQERHGSTPANLVVVKQPCTGRATEASDKLAAAVHSVINETAQLEKDFADYVADFESLISAHSNFIQQIDDKLEALEVDEAAAEAAEVATAPEQANSSHTALGADPSSRAEAVPKKWEPGLPHAKLSQKRDPPTTAQGLRSRPFFPVKKVPSKWAGAAKRKVGRSGEGRGGIEYPSRCS